MKRSAVQMMRSLGTSRDTLIQEKAPVAAATAASTGEQKIDTSVTAFKPAVRNDSSNSGDLI